MNNSAVEDGEENGSGLEGPRSMAEGGKEMPPELPALAAEGAPVEKGASQFGARGQRSPSSVGTTKSGRG